LAQSLDWARQCPATSTVKVLTSVRVSTRAKMPSFRAKIKVNEAVAKMPPRVRPPALAAAGQGALPEPDRHLLENSRASYPDAIGQSARRVERLGTPAVAVTIKSGRRRGT
jgi:hypothetical protein